MIDGLLLIVAHATMSPMGEGCYNTPSNAFYGHVYDSKYVYGVWLIEVCHVMSFSFSSLLAALTINKAILKQKKGMCKFFNSPTKKVIIQTVI